MTANDSDVSDGDILTGSQVVRVYGENLTYPFVTLTFGDVEYTPLAQGEGYIEFLLGDNGTATINVDGSRFMSFEVEGIVVPSLLPTRIEGGQFDGIQNVVNRQTIGNANCINYAFVENPVYPIFMFTFGSPEHEFVDIDESSWAGVNCSITSIRLFAESRTRLLVRVTDASVPATIRYKGFIIAVFNYTTD